MDSEDKTALALFTGGLIAAALAVNWKDQIQGRMWITSPEDWEDAYKLSMVPALIVDFGNIAMGASAFVRTKTYTVLKAIAGIYVIFYIIMAIGRINRFRAIISMPLS
jgi:hypothetical protein